MDPIFERRELVRRINVLSRNLQRNIQTSILSGLKMKYEGICTPEGYIAPNSITILDYSLGRANYLKGGIDYDVRFGADICMPHSGQTFKAKVVLKSKIGLHAEVEPLKILIPRDLHIGNEEFEKTEVEQDIEFEVIGAQFKQQDRDIVVVGRLKSAIPNAPAVPLLSVQEQTKPVSASSISGDGSEEKTISVVPVESPEKPKRKLRRGGELNLNAKVEEGVA